MTWLKAHTRSEELASAAEIAELTGRYPEAMSLYHAAAKEEDQAFSLVDDAKSRTVGILAVSAAALYIKARQFQDAERAAVRGLNRSTVGAPHRFQLRQLLQDTWIEQDKVGSDTKFLPGQVHVSVKGGQVIYGAESWLRKSGQCDKWNFCLTAGNMSPLNRRDHEQIGRAHV